MVTVNEIAVALGRAQPAQDSLEAMQWDLWISDATLLIRAKLGDPELLDQENLRYVIREAVCAKARRPDEATQVDVAVDDGRVSRTYAKSTGTVHIRPEWWDLLSSAASGAFSIGPEFQGCR